MKKTIYLSALLCLLAASAFSQSSGQIDSFRVLPAHPGPMDTVKVLAWCTFPYSGCQLSNSAVDQQTPAATATHCIGMLAAICHYTDTFTLAPRPSGNYHFTLRLLTANAPVCSPIIISDMDSVSFDVSGPTVIGEGIKHNSSLNTLYSHGQLFIYSLPPGFDRYDIQIISMAGQVVCNKAACLKDVPVIKELSSGIYLISIRHNEQRLWGRVVVE